jgi:hypothetical protein
LRDYIETLLSQASALWSLAGLPACGSKKADEEPCFTGDWPVRGQAAPSPDRGDGEGSPKLARLGSLGYGLKRYFAASTRLRTCRSRIGRACSAQRQPSPGERAAVAEIPFVDTHFHLHDLKRPELRYSWLEPDAVHGFLGKDEQTAMFSGNAEKLFWI